MLPEYHDEIRNLVGFSSYIKEYRTIALNVPRCVGKTTAIARLGSEMSSLIITTNQVMVENYRKNLGLYAISDVEGFICSTLGNRLPNRGMKYRAILIDERNLHNIDMLVIHLLSSNALEKDFFILQVGTK